MPLIKDKYAAKGPKIRSEYEKRASIEERKDIEQRQGLNTQQKQTQQTKIIRESNARYEGEPSSRDIAAIREFSSILNVKITTVGAAEFIFTLPKGKKLNDIIIANFTPAGTASVVSLVWSRTKFSDLTLVGSGGVIKTEGDDIEGGAAGRLITFDMPNKTSLSLGSSGILNGFNNLSNDLHFIAACSVTGPEFTILME